MTEPQNPLSARTPSSTPPPATWPPSDRRRALVAGGTLSAGVLLALVVYAMVNYLAMRHYARFDWTSTELYTLSQKSQSVVESLPEDVALEAVVFLSPADPIYAAVDELLDRYAAANPDQFQKRVIDPAKDLLAARQLVERFEIDRENVVVLARGDERRVISDFEMAEYDYSGAQLGQPPKITAFKGEQLITSAILELVEASKPKILFTTGHGEAPTAAGSQRSLAQARTLLGEDNFEIDEWQSLGAAAVPPQTDLVVVAGPTAAFVEPELEVFRRYLASGGRMLFLLDPALSESLATIDLGLAGFLAEYGVTVHDDVVIDPNQALPFFGPETIFTSSYGSHPVVDDLARANVPVLMPLARSLAEGDGPGEVTTLVRTSPEGWGETDLSTSEVALDEADNAGPLALAVAVAFPVAVERAPAPQAEAAVAEAGEPAAATEASDDAETGDDAEADDDAADTVAGEGADEGRLVVFGDSDFASDAQLGNGGNASLLLNSFNWLVQREELIAIDAREIEETRISLSAQEMRNLTWLVMVLMPLVAIATGVMVFLRRRR